MNQHNIEKIVCDVFNINQTDLYIKTRKRHICLPRQVCMTIYMSLLKYNSSYAASIYSLRNHVTALHAKKVIDNLCETDKIFKEKIDLIYQMLSKEISISCFEPRTIDLLQLSINYTKELNN